MKKLQQILENVVAYKNTIVKEALMACSANT